MFVRHLLLTAAAGRGLGNFSDGPGRLGACATTRAASTATTAQASRAVASRTTRAAMTSTGLAARSASPDAQSCRRLRFRLPAAGCRASRPRTTRAVWISTTAKGRAGFSVPNYSGGQSYYGSGGSWGSSFPKLLWRLSVPLSMVEAMVVLLGGAIPNEANDHDANNLSKPRNCWPTMRLVAFLCRGSGAGCRPCGPVRCLPSPAGKASMD